MDPTIAIDCNTYSQLFMSQEMDGKQIIHRKFSVHENFNLILQHWLILVRN